MLPTLKSATSSDSYHCRICRRHRYQQVDTEGEYGMSAGRVVVSQGEACTEGTLHADEHCRSITFLVASGIKMGCFPVARASPMKLRTMFVRLAILARRVFSCEVDVILSSVAVLSIKSTLTYIRDHDHAPWSDMLILILYILITYFITRSMIYDIVYKRHSAYYAFFMEGKTSFKA